MMGVDDLGAAERRRQLRGHRLGGGAAQPGQRPQDAEPQGAGLRGGGAGGGPATARTGGTPRPRRPPPCQRPGRGPKVTSSQSTSPARARASSSGYRSPPPYSPSGPNALGATWMTRMLTVSLVTLGDPGRLTGGYRYHRRMAELAPACDASVRFVSVPDRPLPRPALAGPGAPRRDRADALA